MHIHFYDWYRPCTTGTETNLGDLLQRRWTGVAKLADESAEHAIHFVRIVLQQRAVPADVMTAFKAAFKDADPAFQMSGNELELSVLAGAVACHVMADAHNEADTAALGLVCATTILTAPPWATPFTVCAKKYLKERLHAVRGTGDLLLPQLLPRKLKPQIDTFVSRIADNNPAQASEAAKQLLESLLLALATATETASAAIAELERQSRLRREETDILWWMNAGISRDLGKSFKDLKTLAASVVAGKELASLARPPGVLPAAALLQGIIPPGTGRAAGKPIGLIAAVNATPREWRQSVATSLAIDPIADLSPVLAAIKHSLTTDEDDTWTAAYKKAMGIKADIFLEPADLGLQVHRECLLAKLVTPN